MAGQFEGQVDEFVERWSLGANVAEYIRSVDEETRQKVLTEFSPRDGTVNVEGKLFAFMRSLQNRGVQARPSEAELAQIGPELDEFCVKWGLDTAGMAWLNSLPVEVSKVVIKQFEPKEDTQNMMGKLKAFARSVMARQPGLAAAGPVHGGPGQAANWHQTPRASSPSSVSLADFAARWELDETTVTLLRAYDPEVQATVVAQFHPRGEVHNVNGKLLAFAKSIAQSVQSQNAVDSFANWWQLDESSKGFLLSLPEDVRRTVMEQFDPAPDTRDYGGKLRTFARSIMEGSQAPSGSGHAFVPWSSSPASSTKDHSGGAPITPTERAFLSRWGLQTDPKAVSAMQRLPQPVRLRVMNEFAPPQDTHSMASRFCSFAASVARSAGIHDLPVGGGAPIASVHNGSTSSFGASSSSAGKGGYSGFASGSAGSFGHSPVAIERFAARWGLDVASKAFLRGLSPLAQETVMAEFNPKGDTVDGNGKFLAFARSVQQRMEAGKRPLAAVGLPQQHLQQQPWKRPRWEGGAW